METTISINAKYVSIEGVTQTRGQCSHLEGILLLQLLNREQLLLPSILARHQLHLEVITRKLKSILLMIVLFVAPSTSAPASTGSLFNSTTSPFQSQQQQQQQTTVTSPSTYPFQYLQQCFDPNSVNYRFRVSCEGDLKY